MDTAAAANTIAAARRGVTPPCLHRLPHVVAYPFPADRLDALADALGVDWLDLVSTVRPGEQGICDDLLTAWP